MTIVLIATGWDSAEGGISAFNIPLAKALARRVPGGIACAILSKGPSDRPRNEDGVLLLPVAAGQQPDRPAEDCGGAIVAMLQARGLPPVTHWLGHDLITGPAALRAARDHGGKAAIVHHMDYLAYQNLGGGRGKQTVDNRGRQIELFSEADIVFGVGARLTRIAQELGDKIAHNIIPGFPEARGVTHRKVAGISAISAGRFDEKSEPVKQSELIVGGFGRAVFEAGLLVEQLKSPTLTLLGVEDRRAALLRDVIHQKAGRKVNLVAAPFSPDPAAFATHCSRANLAILGSRHEGFGLVGWEAIGTGTPLILGGDTGLAEQLRETLPTTCDSLATILDMGCDDDEMEARLSTAIIQVAKDIPLALKKAAQLRDALINELGCNWDDSARRLLEVLGFADTASGGTTTKAGIPAVAFDCHPTDYFPECVELSLSAGQGATARSVELIAELRFGKAELDVGGVEAEISLRAARLRVITESGRLEGARLGDRARPAPGIEARAGGIWALSAEKGASLPNKALGDEALCRIEAPLDIDVSATVEVTAAMRDLNCKIHKSGKAPRPTTARVMEIFLKDAIFKENSGHILFSSARLEEGRDADG